MHSANYASNAPKEGKGSLLKELLKTPLQVGAICPSSRRLANRMAASVDPDTDGFVVELGAGTGVITESLLRRGVLPDRLIVIEKSAALAHHLSRRFPGVRVLHSDAADIPSIISNNEKVKAVVSSLPLRSLPRNQVARISLAWAHALAAHGRVVQFTYAPFSASAWMQAGLERTSHGTEWANMPPALVEVFSKG
jgi:phosphatidylethanolamine/phosphatidyl-N-methylethanolamine N-methyltransferase